MSEQSPEQKRKLLPIVIVGIILAALCGISLYIRIALPYDQIFVNDWVWFRETDAYYHMRHIETLVHNFPHFNPFDLYVLYPGGGMGLLRPFFDWLIVGIIRLISSGIPPLHTMEAVAAYMPAVLGTLTLIPVYFIGKELFNRWVGVIAAALVVILPSEFLHRSLLGFTDHHVAETLFSTVSILFLIMAIKRAREREISFGHILNRDWSTITKPLVYTLLAGIFLGIYLISWIGGLLFIFIIFAYLVIQFIVDHLRHKSSDYLCIVGTPVFLIAFLMLLAVVGGGLDTSYRVSLTVAIVLPIVLSIISRLLAARALKPVYYPLVLLGLAGIGLAALHAIKLSPDLSLLQYMLSQFSIFTPTGAALTIQEVEPLLLPEGAFGWQTAWGNFTTSFFIAFIAFVMLIYPAVKGKMIDKILFLVWIIILLITVRFQWLFGWFIFLAILIYFATKEKGADKILFLLWSIIMLMATLGQRRFGYYYTINAALLTGYFSWKMLDIAGLSKLLAKPKEVVGAVKKFKKRKRTREKAKQKIFMQPRGAWVNVIIVGIVIFFLVFFPNIGNAKALARTPSIAYISMAEGWYSSLLWLKESDNSPEPFDDPEFYYELYQPQDEFEYPETAYGVTSWWDYGYFIMQIAHRIPNANPTQAGARKVGQFFTAQNESSAQEIVEQYDLNTKYVMIDYEMSLTKFYAMVEWAGGNVDEFYEGYYVLASGGALNIVILHYPPYYNSTVARLYNFDGKAVVPSANSTTVISWQWKTGEELLKSGYKVIVISQDRIINIETGKDYKMYVDHWFFSSYEDAEAYVSSQESGNYAIGGFDPYVTIVPLEELNSYELVHQSKETITVVGHTMPGVKIFKYLGSGGS